MPTTTAQSASSACSIPAGAISVIRVSPGATTGPAGAITGGRTTDPGGATVGRSGTENGVGATDGCAPASPDCPLKLGRPLGLGATPGGITAAELAESRGVGVAADGGGATQGAPPAPGRPPLHGPAAGE
ncbi:hypothetical protein GCM10009735_60760 [Actinomadura chokoriensis]